MTQHVRPVGRVRPTPPDGTRSQTSINLTMEVMGIWTWLEAFPLDPFLQVNGQADALMRQHLSTFGPLFLSIDKSLFELRTAPVGSHVGEWRLE